MKKMEKFVQNYIWQDRKRPILGLPLSFTRYKLTNEKFIVETGFFSITQEEVRLYRIMDLTVKCSLIQRLFNVGTIQCCSADKTTPEFYIRDVKNAIQVKELISKKVEEERQRKRIGTRECMISDGDDDDFDNHIN